MSGRKAWLAAVLAFILGAGTVVTAMTLLRGSPATSVDPIRLESPTDSEDEKKDGKRDVPNKKKRDKGAGEPPGTREQPSSGGAPAAPPPPPAPAGDDDDDDDGDDDSGDDDDD
jgi:hypothetical protein